MIILHVWQLVVLGFGLAPLACVARDAVNPDLAPSPPRAAPSAPQLGTFDAPGAPSLVNLRVIAFNDFHGNLEPLIREGRPQGGATALAAHVRHAQTGYAGRALIVHAGDQVGASPPSSGLLQDEPAIALLNLLANEHCQLPARDSPECDVVGTLGNHEFDEGVPELLRLLRGGNFAKGPFLQSPYLGARIPYVSANVIDASNQTPLLPAYVVRTLGGIEVGVIGAVLSGARQLLNPASPGLDAVEFVDEVTAINRAASELVTRGVHVIILAIHQGLEQEYYAGQTQHGLAVAGDLMAVTSSLHDEIDVVVSGHTHAFTNTYVVNAAGRELLVVQSLSAGRAVATVDLVVHSETNEVLSKVAQVQYTYGDIAPGNQPQPDVSALVTAAATRVAAQTSRVVGTANVEFPRSFNESGESPLGSVIADAQRHAGKADFALTNPGGIRTGLSAGAVTWGQLFTVQPFGNRLVLVTLTGRELRALLERQWADESAPRFLQISGFSYEWDAAAPRGKRVVAMRGPNGATLAAARKYQVVVNDYMASGGDGFGLSEVVQTKLEKTDLEALVEYFLAQPNGVDAPAAGRIRRRAAIR